MASRKYVVAGGKAPWPHSPYLTYGPAGLTVYVGETVSDLPGEDISYLLEAGYIVPEGEYVAPEEPPPLETPDAEPMLPRFDTESETEEN